VIRVAVRIPAVLAPLAGGQRAVAVDVPAPDGGAVPLVRVLEALWAIHPGVRDRVLTEQGALRPHVNLFVGPESVRFSGGLATSVPDGAEVSILPAVSGGAASAFNQGSDARPAGMQTAQV
jgi:molybdopterin converting factor small subunit